MTDIKEWLQSKILQLKSTIDRMGYAHKLVLKWEVQVKYHCCRRLDACMTFKLREFLCSWCGSGAINVPVSLTYTPTDNFFRIFFEL